MILPMAAFVVLSIAGIAIGGSSVRPTSTASEVLTYAQEHAGAMRLQAFFGMASAVPLSIVAAIAYRRLRALGITAPGSAIALVGGTLAAGFAATSGLAAWIGSRVQTDAELAAAIRDVVFVTGGVGFVPFFGLLIAGIAVPMLVLNIWRPFAIAGIAIAFVAELSTLMLITMNASIALPIGRFGGILWLLAACFLLPATRPRRAGAVEELAESVR